MIDMQPKKMIILDILDILRKHNRRRPQALTTADTEFDEKRVWNESRSKNSQAESFQVN